MTVQVDVAADDRGIGGKAASPVAVADDGDRVRARRAIVVVLSAAGRAEWRRRGQEVAARDELAIDPGWRPPAIDAFNGSRNARRRPEDLARRLVSCAAAPQPARRFRCETRECSARSAVLARRRTDTNSADCVHDAAALIGDEDELLGMSDRKRPPQQAIHQGEQRGRWRRCRRRARAWPVNANSGDRRSSQQRNPDVLREIGEDSHTT